MGALARVGEIAPDLGHVVDVRGVPASAGDVAIRPIIDNAFRFRYGTGEVTGGPPSPGAPPMEVLQPDLKELEEHLEEMYGDE
jgi:hypothetical protein